MSWLEAIPGKTRECSSCGRAFPGKDFRPTGSKKILGRKCVNCIASYMAKYRRKHPEKYQGREEYLIMYRRQNANKLSSYRCQYYLKHKEALKRKHADWKNSHKLQIITWARKYFIQNKERIKQKQKEYNLSRNGREVRKNYVSIRMKTEPQFRLIRNLRRRLNLAVHYTMRGKFASTISLLGCNIVFLKKYLESKFLQGMSWDNYGKNGWHIDHIKPCVAFDLSKAEQQKDCFNFKNLQPLWAHDNLVKNAKIA